MKVGYRMVLVIAGAALVQAIAGCGRSPFISSKDIARIRSHSEPKAKAIVKPLPQGTSKAIVQLIDGAVEQVGKTTSYDPAYVQIDFPGGDVPAATGVCSDVVVRAFRKAGVDLQKEINTDMKANFAAYPTTWGLSSPDSNIDHRRVPNLRTFFERKGKSLPITSDAGDYKPGDVVTWVFSTGQTHTGIVVNHWSNESKRYLIAHNIGAGAQIEDVLFAWDITGHYRYF